jgi:hypothetical protein
MKKKADKKPVMYGYLEQKEVCNHCEPPKPFVLPYDELGRLRLRFGFSVRTARGEPIRVYDRKRIANGGKAWEAIYKRGIRMMEKPGKWSPETAPSLRFQPYGDRKSGGLTCPRTGRVKETQYQTAYPLKTPHHPLKIVMFRSSGFSWGGPKGEAPPPSIVCPNCQASRYFLDFIYYDGLHPEKKK